jgi:DNA-binding transcriptional regulator LsrR (DeoR family)
MDAAQPSEDDLLVQVAWLYYVGDRNQEEIAQAVGLSRFKITRLLAKARERGLVKISIEHRSTDTLALADAVSDRFALAECIVTPRLGQAAVSPEAEGRARRAVGIASAHYLARRLQPPEPITIGVGWGRTLGSMVDALTGIAKPNARFVSLMGALSRTARTNPFEVVHTLAQACGGESYLLPAPFIADSEEDYRVIMSQRLIRETLTLARLAAFHMVSFGPCSRESFIFRHGLVSEAEMEEVIAAGAVGDMMGKFFDRYGYLVASPINQRTPGLSIEDMRRQDILLLAAGLEKAEALAAVLRSGTVDRLIVDGDLAVALLAIPPV